MRDPLEPPQIYVQRHTLAGLVIGFVFGFVVFLIGNAPGKTGGMGLVATTTLAGWGVGFVVGWLRVMGEP